MDTLAITVKDADGAQRVFALAGAAWSSDVQDDLSMGIIFTLQTMFPLSDYSPAFGDPLRWQANRVIEWFRKYGFEVLKVGMPTVTPLPPGTIT